MTEYDDNEKPAPCAGFSRHHYHLLCVGGVSYEMSFRREPLELFGE